MKTVDYIDKIDAFLEKYFGRQNNISEEQLRPAAGKDRRPPAPPLKTIEKAYLKYLKIS